MKAEIFVPEVANHVPHLRVTWDASAVGISANDVVKALKDGEPSIATRNEGPALVIGVWMMRPGEEKIVARRLSRCSSSRPRRRPRRPKASSSPAERRPERAAKSASRASGRGAPRALINASTAANNPVARDARVGLAGRAGCQQASGAVKFPADIAPRNDILIENRVPIPMRDGVTLYADVYRPVGDARYPVIVSRTPYSTERFPTAYDAAVYFAQRGYVYVFQDVRGRHESDGRWEPFFDDEKDGYDTIEWAAKQRWSDGKVAMQGGSYLGQNQWRAAQAAPPSLVTIFPMVASTSIYHDWITLNGGWRLSFNFGWGPVRQESRIMQNPGPHTVDGVRAIHYDEVQKHLPLKTMQQLVGRQAKFYDDWLAHPDYDTYWKPLNVGGGVPEDLDSRAHLRRMVRHLQPGNASRLCRDEPEGRRPRRPGA